MFQLWQVLDLALNIYSWGIIIYIFMSWFPGARESTFGEILGKITEPYLEMFRKFIPPLGMIDFSPIIAIFVLHLARNGLLQFFNMFLF
ncbi:YggT family protein [Oceanobacillus piezotolerans]|uniref:YggT family protein n=1 Tax=Oceanobacillus piezotolerans TaxID=2448030 RepID=A0A498D6A0_9BACI|nr:YggT family protein [Oceanobacillus piezotolerans]RLL45248.1 YggT family protein [Oceanobacillus piezotolerans]